MYDWFLPIHQSPGDGIRFEYNEVLVKKLKARGRYILESQAGRRVEPAQPNVTATASAGAQVGHQL